ncbi:glycosyltransferase [Schleiferiaceae bacterium]|nr:glycosyltransferase [Schleiferiaceae bacterium]
MKLLVISHTEHVKFQGKIYGLGSTVRELNNLCGRFSEITHLAPCTGEVEKVPLNYVGYTSNIKYEMIPSYGGKTILGKLTVILRMPEIIWSVFRALKQNDYFQFRAPTAMGLYIIPMLTYCYPNKTGWYKYAGNWIQETPPLSYLIQKKILLLCNHRKVTINGNWPDKTDILVPFENPCLTIDEFNKGKIVRAAKDYSNLQGCFIGRLDSSKGFEEVLRSHASLVRLNIKLVHVVGEGIEQDSYKEIAKNLSKEVEYIFYGALSPARVHEVLIHSHCLFLPSKSEGFPKVVSEGLNYGVIPFVSDVSCISQYINDSNGYLIKDDLSTTLETVMENTIGFQHNIDESDLYKFTYEYYSNRICNEILTNDSPEITCKS